jgi:prepilin-type N-terminal cleavage/methylation domain-containing protein
MSQTLKKRRSRGLTLIELMISILMLSLILVAIYSIMIAQQTRSEQVSRTTIMQTDAQVALTLLKWDLMMSGLGYPFNDPAVITGINSNAVPDEVTIRSVGLGFEINKVHWGYVLTLIPSGSSTVEVRRFDDPKIDFAPGDVVGLFDQNRNPIKVNMTVQTVVPYNYTFPSGETVPANHVTLSQPFTKDVSDALCMFSWNPNLYFQGIRFNIVNNQLMRNGEALLDNVEDFQIAYGLDQNHDGVIELWQNTVPTNPSFLRKWALRFTMVVTSRGMPGYQWTGGNIQVEDHNYNPLAQANGLRKKRTFMSTVVYPQNLQP